MANAFADQLKDLGLRHGEKAGVAIASMIFLVCAGMAASTKTIETTPDQIKQAAQASDKNLTRHEERDTIIKNLESNGIKDSNFAGVVDDQVKTALAPDNYKSAREWVTPEPGAGLIRDTPVLIAPTDLYAYPGRGGLLVYALDKDGNRIPDEGTKDVTKPERKGRRRRRTAAGGMGGMMGGMGGMGAPRKKAVKSKADILRELKAEDDRKARILQGKLTGPDQPEDENAKEKDAEAKEPPGKEIVKGYRWVAITGTIDHAKMLANYRQALKTAVAQPNYKRLDLQRQTLERDGSRSKWTIVSSDENYKVLDNLPEWDEELTPDNVRPENLVDPLPFLKSGLWEKVHIASLVPKEAKEVPKSVPPMGGMMGGMGMMGGGKGGGMMPGGMMGGMGMMGGGKGGGMMPGGMMGGMGMMRGMMGGGKGGEMMPGGMMGGMGMMGGGFSEAAGNYWKSDAKKVMIRALDFTVEPDTTYRYKVRIVVHNPNYKREDVSALAKEDTKAEELRGPWSVETDPVSMPPDVMPYVMGTMPAGLNRVKIHFDVIRFHPQDGVTVPKPFDAGPGELLGEARTAEVPVSDGSGKKSHTIDFTSNQIVLDIFPKNPVDGLYPLPAGMLGGPVERLGLALLLRPDGSVMVHNEAEDSSNAVRRDIADNYKHELSMSKQVRKSSAGSGYMGMMGMGGMMGGGYGGMMGGGYGGGMR